MIVSLFGLASALLSGTTLLLLLRLFWEPVKRSLGISTLLILYLLCAARMVFPVEITFFSIPKISVVSQLSQGDDSLWLYGIFFLWGCPAAVLLVAFWVRYLRGVRNLSKKAGCRCRLAEEVLNDLQREYSGPRNVQVLLCPEVKIPLGAGLLRKRIVLPQRDYSQEELSYILQHEYTHFCNGDLWIKFITCVFRCVFWWNPAAYLFQRDVAQLLELRCDRAVTCGLSKEEKAAYLSVLLDAVKQAGRKNGIPNTVGIPLFSEPSRRGMVERFQAVMAKSERRGPWRNCVAFVVVLGAVTVSLLLAASPGVSGRQPVTATTSKGSESEKEPIWRFDIGEGTIQLPEQQAREWLESRGYEVELATMDEN